MQENIDPREALSALLDGEATGDSARFLARRLENDAAMTGQVARWQFAGDVLRESAGARAEVDLLASIQKKLASQVQAAEMYAPATAPRRSSAKAWFGGLAMAATLGVVAIAVRPALDKQATTADASSNPVVVLNTPVTATEPSVTTPPPETIMTASLPVQAQAVATVTNANAATQAVRPWRVPADADALIARANAAPVTAATAEPEVKAPASSERPRAQARQLAGVASVPNAIKRADDVERVLRGRSEQGVLGVDPSAHPGWPRSVIPGIDGAFNASFNTGSPSSFGQRNTPEAPQP